MRRIALVLATVGVIVAGLASIPAQAHEGWWGGHRGWHESEWREHHYRHAHFFERHVLPRHVFHLFHH